MNEQDLEQRRVLLKGYNHGFYYSDGSCGRSAARDLRREGVAREVWVQFMNDYADFHMQEFCYQYFSSEPTKVERAISGTISAGPKPFDALEAIVTYDLDDDRLQRTVSIMDDLVARDGRGLAFFGDPFFNIRSINWSAYKRIIPKLRNDNFAGDMNKYMDARDRLLEEVGDDGLDSARLTVRFLDQQAAYHREAARTCRIF